MTLGSMLLPLLLHVPGEVSRPCPMVSDIKVSPDERVTGALLYERKPEVAGNELLPRALVLLRDGKYQREIRSGPFVWHWMFWQGSGKIAADMSPLHFLQVFKLIDVSSGKDIDSAVIEQEPSIPAWAQALSDLENKPAPSDPPRKDCRFRPLAQR